MYPHNDRNFAPRPGPATRLGKAHILAHLSPRRTHNATHLLQQFTQSGLQWRTTINGSERADFACGLGVTEWDLLTAIDDLLVLWAITVKHWRQYSDSTEGIQPLISDLSEVA